MQAKAVVEAEDRRTQGVYPLGRRSCPEVRLSLVDPLDHCPNPDLSLRQLLLRLSLLAISVAEPSRPLLLPRK